MPHHKRRKSRRNVRCALCTTHRWLGNSKGRLKAKDQALIKDHEAETRDMG